MAARPGRPLLLIDLAVPRDIHPDCREVTGVDPPRHGRPPGAGRAKRLRARGARRASAEGVLRAELARFERWLDTQDVTPTIAALRARADEVVERVLAENESRWEGLTDADRERLEAMARAIASRLLHEPTMRMRRSAGDDDAYAKVAALRELFGLDPESQPLGDEGEVRELRRRDERG